MGNVYSTPPERPYDDSGTGADVIAGVILAILVVVALLWILFANPFSTTTTTPVQPNSGQTINVNNPPSGSNSAQPTAMPSGSSNTGSNTGNNSQPVIGTNPTAVSSSNGGSSAQPTAAPTSSSGG